MKRRAFITLLGASATWPLAARSQQGERVRRINVLHTIAANDADGQARNTAFLQGLQQLGWTDGRNVRIETRWSADADQIRSYVAELVAVAPDVILASGSATVGPLLQATRSVPIVFTNVPDPVGAGFVNSLARPGGNLTGINFFNLELAAKRLELLRELVPGATRAAVLVNPANPANAETTLLAAPSAASAMGLQIQFLNASSSRESPPTAG